MQTLFSNSDQIIIDAYNAYQSSLINYISVRVGDKELAKDLSQDVFLRLVSYKSMIRKDTVRSMIYTIAYNLIIDYLRRYYKNKMVFLLIYMKNLVNM